MEQPVGTGFSQGVPNIRVRIFGDKALMVVPDPALFGFWIERRRSRRTTRRVSSTILRSFFGVEEQEILCLW